MRFAAALEGRLDEYMAAEARGIRAGVLKAVTDTTIETKNLARAHVASRLGFRAGFLITHVVYNNNGYDAAGLIYSRWKRSRPGGKFVNETSELFGRSRNTDILGAHAYGAVIEPRRSKFLYIPLVRGRLRRTQRRIFQQGIGRDTVELVPFTDKHGNLAYIIREKRRRGQGPVIALLIQRVELKRSLNLDPIYRRAETSLARRLIVEIDRAARAD